MSDVCVIINEPAPDKRRKSSSDVADNASNRQPTMANEEDDDADDEEDDEQDESDYEEHFRSRISITTGSQHLDLDGSIVVGGTARRRGSVCSSCDTYSSRSDRDLRGSRDSHRDVESVASSRSTREYSPTRDNSSGDDQDENLPYPGFRPVTLFCMTQTSHPRDWCLKMITNPYPFGFV